MAKKEMTAEENRERLERLHNVVASLPEQPGSYQYYNREGEVIYVGKAKNLKRRVASYFNKEQQSRKTVMLVSHIWEIRYIVVKTEEDALLLENNLIKRFQPRYNVLLKDGKTYPSICISREDFPKIYKTRHIDHKHGEYFGPYSHVGALYSLLQLLQELYRPRPCKMAMSEEGVHRGKYELCLNYQIKKCLAPCVGKQSREAYMESIAQCRQILRGNTDDVLRRMKEEMDELAAQLRFEEAQAIKERYDLLSNWQARSAVVSPSNNNIDVFNIEVDSQHAYVNYLHITKGSITQAYTFEYRKQLDETAADLLPLGIVEMRQRYGSDAREVVVPFEIDLPLTGVSVVVPQRGEKRKLLELSALNVQQYKFDRLKQAEKLNPEQRAVRLMTEIQQHLKLPKLPIRIELFDNSNVQGSDPVAACVVFEKLKPKKSDYRKYNIRTVKGPNDYASMQEVVRRRYTRLIEEQSPLPDLIITDGGRGQMECVRKVVEDELSLHIPIAGLAKDARHRTNELLYGFPPVVIGMKQTSELFRVLTQMQDEVHRFAITFHRQKRLKSQIHSELDDIPGVGKATKALLLKHFKSVTLLKEAPEQAIQELLGPVRGQRLYDALHPIKPLENTEE